MPRPCFPRFALGFLGGALLAAGLLLQAPQAFAFGANECAASRKGSDLGCTAQDVSITGIAVAPGSPTSCVGGSTYTVDLDVTVNFATPDRWDIGIFLSRDGKDPQLLPASGGANSCTVGILPTSAPFLNLDPAGGTDTCGDGNGTISGGTGSGVVRLSAVPVSCQASPLSNGNLFIPFVVTWDNQKTPPGLVCASIADPVPNTVSKCNAPNSAVATEVQYGTVGAVVLPSISKSDGITTITAGNSSTYSVVITNTTGATLNDVIFRDPAVSNLTVNSLGCAAAGGASCPATYTIPNMQGGGILLPAMPVDSSVTFTIGATVNAGTPAGTITNTASVTVRGETNAASDTNNVITRFNVAKSFAPASINVGGTSLLIITLGNTNLGAATNVAFTDTYPANLVNTGTPGETNSCGGTVTATAGGNSLALSGGTIAAGGSCTITVNVTSAVGGAYNNSTGAISSTQYSGDAATASLAVGVSSLATATKTWQDLNGGEADPGDLIRYTITLAETAGVTATGVSIADLLPATLSGATVASCPAGATCSVVGQTLTASNITVPANGSVALVFNATIPLGTAAGTSVNNCADIANPSGIGASPCASTITVSPSAVATAGNKWLYLFNSTSLSRAKPAGTPAAVTIASGASQPWALSPSLALPVTISPNVTPLAIIPVNLYLASNVANSPRTVQATVTCSGGGASYSETKIFDGTALHNPYLPTTPTLVSFNNLTIAADQTCAAGQSWTLTVRNNSTAGNILVYPVSGGNNSYLSLPSLNVINVDSVTSYSAAYPAVTPPAGGTFTAGQTVYVRAVVSDPFGSYDITAASVTIQNPAGTNVVTSAAMTQVADSGTSTKTFEYAYTIPAGGAAGSWAVIVTANEGTENTVADSGIGAFQVGVNMPNLSFLKLLQVEQDPVNGSTAPQAIPGADLLYTLLVTNNGSGAVDGNSLIFVDPIPTNTRLFVGDLGAGSPVLFADPDGDSGFTPPQPFTLSYSSKSDCSNYGYTPVAVGGFDANVCRLRAQMSGTFAGASGAVVPDFSLTFRIRLD